MANEGPFGFPRVTNIGPFVDKKTEQVYKREEIGKPNYLPIYRAVAESHNINLDESITYRSSLKVIQEQEEPDNTGILGDIEKAINSLTTDTEIAHIRYFIHKKSKVGAIGGIKTSEDFRGMGIATELKEKEMQFMKEQGIEVVFTNVVSEGGFRLSKKTDFRPIDEYDGPIGDMNFNPEFNRGEMFKHL